MLSTIDRRQLGLSLGEHQWHCRAHVLPPSLGLGELRPTEQRRQILWLGRVRAPVVDPRPLHVAGHLGRPTCPLPKPCPGFKRLLRRLGQCLEQRQSDRPVLAAPRDLSQRGSGLRMAGGKFEHPAVLFGGRIHVTEIAATDLRGVKRKLYPCQGIRCAGGCRGQIGRHA